MTSTILGPDCRLPIGGGNCLYPAGHNGDCDPNPQTGAVRGYRATVRHRTRNRRHRRTGPRVLCDLSRGPAQTDHFAGADFCRNCGATNHPPAHTGGE